MVLRIVCDVFFLVSLVFALAGTKGIIKMPDIDRPESFI